MFKVLRDVPQEEASNDNLKNAIGQKLTPGPKNCCKNRKLSLPSAQGRTQDFANGGG